MERAQRSHGFVLSPRFQFNIGPMRRIRAAIVLVFLALTLLAPAQTQVKRQPAPVMGAAGADWLTRPERIQEEDPDRMLASLNIKKGSVVADIGAGVGYHTWRLSKLVGPEGRVIAEDVQQEMLRLLKMNIDEQKLSNV